MAPQTMAKGFSANLHWFLPEVILLPTFHSERLRSLSIISLEITGLVLTTSDLTLDSSTSSVIYKLMIMG